MNIFSYRLLGLVFCFFPLLNFDPVLIYLLIGKKNLYYFTNLFAILKRRRIRISDQKAYQRSPLGLKCEAYIYLLQLNYADIKIRKVNSI